MQTREKIIVAMAGAGLLYFMIDTFALSDASGPSAATDLSLEYESFVTEGQAALGSLEQAMDLFYSIELLNGTADGRNPFVRGLLPAEGATAEEPARGTSHRIRYTGFFQCGAVSLAVINGKEYAVNDLVEAFDLQVREITSDRVLLQARTLKQDGEATELTVVPREVVENVL